MFWGETFFNKTVDLFSNDSNLFQNDLFLNETLFFYGEGGGMDKSKIPKKMKIGK